MNDMPLDHLMFSRGGFVPIRNPSDSEKRKRLELDLVRTIDEAIQSGLDIHFIAFELEKDGRVNARVTLNDKPAQED